MSELLEVIDYLGTQWVRMDVVQEREQRLAEAEAVIRKLPKTVDGAPVVPGCDIVWRITQDGDVQESYNWHGWGVLFHGGFLSVDPKKCFSTREAAEAAKGGG